MLRKSSGQEKKGGLRRAIGLLFWQRDNMYYFFSYSATGFLVQLVENNIDQPPY